MLLVRVYQCPVCERRCTMHEDQPPPLCCASKMQWKQTREYKPELHGWDTGMRSAAIGFRHTSPWVVPVEGNGPDGQTEVSSLREIRRMEKESEKKAADGLGQEMRFRAFNQDCQNGGMLENSFGPPPQRAPELFDAKGRQKISFDVVDGDTAVDDMGPGAREELASALGPGMDDVS